MESLDAVSVEIRNRRKAAGISQERLARFVRMSQSTIARLESDITSLNPSYGTVYKVLETLENLTNQKSNILYKRASEVMQKRIVFACPDDTVARAVELIKDYDFPQLPVLSRNGSVLGAIYQKRLMAIATQRPEQIEKMRVREILDDGLPQVDRNAQVGKIRKLLESWDAVLVVERNKAIGIITIYDVLRLF